MFESVKAIYNIYCDFLFRFLTALKNLNEQLYANVNNALLGMQRRKFTNTKIVFLLRVSYLSSIIKFVKICFSYRKENYYDKSFTVLTFQLTVQNITIKLSNLLKF